MTVCVRTVLLAGSCILLAACGTQGTRWDRPQPTLAHAGGSSQPAKSLPQAPAFPETGVEVYGLEGGSLNPLANPSQADHSVVENTTSGGYTVFDPSVTVFPLPGDEAPSGYGTPYTASPYEQPMAPMPPVASLPYRPMAAPPAVDDMGMAGLQPLPESQFAQPLPPVPQVEVPPAAPRAARAVRRPEMPAQQATTGPKSLGVLRVPQAPVAEQAPVPSEETVEDVLMGRDTPRGPSLTGADPDVIATPNRRRAGLSVPPAPEDVPEKPVASVPVPSAKSAKEPVYQFKRPRPVSQQAD